MKLEVQVN